MYRSLLPLRRLALLPLPNPQPHLRPPLPHPHHSAHLPDAPPPQALLLGHGHRGSLPNSNLHPARSIRVPPHKRGALLDLVRHDPRGALVDKRVCVHGAREDGVVFFAWEEVGRDQGVAVWDGFCVSGCSVGCFPLSFLISKRADDVGRAFLVQVGGASMASGDDLTHDEVMRGLRIYMIGVGVQQAFIIAFSLLLLRFQVIYQRTHPGSSAHTDSVLHLVYVLYAVLALITVRIIFRLVEYSQGYDSGIPTQEAWTFCFESLPMFVAVLLLNIVHPGRVLPGDENQIPGRKVRKQMIADGLLPSGRRSRKDGKAEDSDVELGAVST